MIRALRSYLPAIAWGSLLYALSSRPTTYVPLESGTDKLVHFGAYALLGFLLARAHSALRWPAWAAVAVGLLYALSDEYHQSFVPGRAADPADWVADALGVGAAVALHSWLRRRGRGPAPRTRGDAQPDTGTS